MSKGDKAKQTTLADLVIPGGVEWTDERIGLHLIPDLPCPDPDADLVESIRVLGILAPVILINRPGGYDLQAGRRRVKAARLVGLTDVPARVADGEAIDLAGAAAVTLIENAQRSPNPLAEYDAIVRLTERGMTESEIARATGIAVGTIRARARLRTLVPQLAAAFRSGEISATVADDLAKLPATHQNGFARRIGSGDRITRKDVADSKRKRSGKAIAALDPVLFSGPGLDVPSGAADASGEIAYVTPGLDGMREAFGSPPEVQCLPAASVDSVRTALAAIVDLVNAERGESWDATLTQIRLIADDAVDRLG